MIDLDEVMRRKDLRTVSSGEIKCLGAEIVRLRASVEDARACAMWLRIVLTNMTQGEQMVGVYERWPWVKGGKP